MLERLTVLATIVFVGSCSNAQAISAPPAQPPVTPARVERKVLQQTPVGEDQELRLMLIEYPPGASAPPHRHPAVGLCYVLEGTAESQYEGHAKVVLHAGDSYQDSATEAHLLWRNPSVTDALRFVCSAKLAVGQEFAVPIP